MTICGYSSMVESRLPKPVVRVRSPLPAPYAHTKDKGIDFIQSEGKTNV